jgi:hypothetical protein
MFDPDALLAEIKGDSGVDDMDALLSELDTLEAATTTTAQFAQPSRPQPTSYNSGLDELESLMSQVQVTPAASRPAPVARAPATGGDDLDDLMAQLGGPATPAPRNPAPVNQPVSAGRGQAAPTLRASPQQPLARTPSAPAPSGGDDLDDLMAQLGGPASTPAPRNPAPVNQPKLPQSQQATVRASPAPSAPASGGDDLDDLMAQLGGPAAPAAPAVQSRPPITRQGSGAQIAPAAGRGRPVTPAVIPPASSGGADDLDDLMAQLGGPAATPAARPIQAAPQSPAQAGRGRGAPIVQAPPAPAPAGGDDLDDLMAQLGGPAVTPVAPVQARTPVARQGSGLSAGRGAPIAQAPAAFTPPTSSGGGDDLDDLMAQLGGPATPAARPVQAAPQSPAQAGRGRGAPIAQAPAPAFIPPASSGGGDDLDDLMAQLGGPVAPAARPVQATPQSPAQAGRGRGAPIAQAPAARAPSGGDDLDDLMAQLGGPAARPVQAAPQSPAQAGRGRGAPITQAPAARAPSGGDDLDDLLGQLGGPAAPRATQPAGANFAGRGGPASPAQNFRASNPPSTGYAPQSNFNQPAGGGDDLDALLGQLGGSPAPRNTLAGVTPNVNTFGAPAAGGRGAAPAGRPVQTFGGPAAGGAGRGMAPASPGPMGRGGGSPLNNTGYSPRTPGQYAPSNPNNLDLNNLLDSMNQQMSNIGGGAPISQNICGTCK